MTLMKVFFIVVAITLVSALLTPILPAPFEILDFFSELSVLTFALMWFVLLKQISDKFDRKVVSIGISLFALGAFADLLDEFGLSLEIRSLVENLSFVAGFLLVSLGLRDWVNNNFVKYQEAISKNEYLALHDKLTGLNNRESLMYALEVRVGRFIEGAGFFALMFMDLDRFKSVNDMLGHQTGDLLLKEVASRMQASLRNTDHCFRIGGDEFVILATDIAKEEDAYLICNKIRDSLIKPVEINGHRIQTDGSFGIALYPRDGIIIEDLLKNADLAMYAAKKKKNHIRFFSEELSDIASNKAEVESDLRSAISNEELYMNYQPIVSQSGSPVAIEALIRWDHPEKGKMHPDQFIPIAEDTGLILPMGDIILRKSLQDYKKYFSNLSDNLAVTVNISVLQLQDDNFPQKVLSALDESGVNPENLILEITESVIMDQVDIFKERMAPLLEAGVRFAMDDFGSGYSSLNYLQKLPVEIIKFDRELLNSSKTSKEDAKILHGLVEITQDLGKQVIVEGIESDNHIDIFSNDKDVLFQGFYFAKPKNKQQIRDWINELANKLPS